MKKLLLLLFSLILSFNSYGETLVCSYLINDEIITLQLKRQGDAFIGVEYGDKNPISNEDNEFLTLYRYISGPNSYLFIFDKESKDFSQHLVGINLDMRNKGKCEVIY